MKPASIKPVRCAIYTRVSAAHGLDQEFNSLDAQYEAASAYIKSQAHAGWTLIRSRYDDGGYSGGSTDRPDLQRLLDDIRARKIDVIVVYKVDRLTRSLAQATARSRTAPMTPAAMSLAVLTTWPLTTPFLAENACRKSKSQRFAPIGALSRSLEGTNPRAHAPRLGPSRESREVLHYF